MAKIFIGIPKHNKFDYFKDSMSQFLPQVKEEHEIELLEVSEGVLMDNQNVIAEAFLQSNKDYLLLLEDDHWGHTLEMLNALIIADTYVCAINYYSRHQGRLSCLMKYTYNKDYRKAYKQASYDNGFHEVDLVPFGMTLIKRQVFDYLDKPYFDVNEFYELHQKDVVNKATDQNFSNKLKAKGINPVGCFDYILPHRDVTEDTYKELRKEDINKLISSFEDKVVEAGFKRLKENRLNRNI